MKIGLDLHGVISDLPEVFEFICESVINNGGQVHILTGGTLERAYQELDDMNWREGQHYTTVFSIVDYHIEKGTRIIGFHPKYKNPEFPDKEWDRTKADYCKRNDIALHIDDSMIYNDHFTTPFARLWTHTDTPKVGKPDRLLS